MTEDERKPSACTGCQSAHNSLNGLFCTRRKRYVEYAERKPCERAEK